MWHDEGMELFVIVLLLAFVLLVIGAAVGRALKARRRAQWEHDARLYSEVSYVPTKRPVVRSVATGATYVPQIRWKIRKDPPYHHHHSSDSGLVIPIYDIHDEPTTVTQDHPVYSGGGGDFGGGGASSSWGGDSGSSGSSDGGSGGSDGGSSD